MATGTGAAAPKAASESLVSCNFEVFGTVQGVFFRKFTQKEAKKLNLVGWVKNVPSGTVQGYMEGRKDNVEKMKVWLRTKGSPKSKITKAVFSNEKTITELTGNAFDIDK